VLNGSATIVLLLVAALSVVFLSIRLFTDSEAAVDYEVPAPDQCSEEWQWEEIHAASLKVACYGPLAKGFITYKKKVEGSSAIQCYCPATGRKLGIVNPYTREGIDRAIERASRAQEEWAKVSFAQRRKVLKTLLKFILNHQDDIVKVACLDSGKTKVDACLGEILVTVEKIQWTIDHGEKALKPEPRPTNKLMLYKSNEVHWEPLGVVAACVSWNYPFHNLLGPIISALFSGNAIVVKGSEQTAWSSAYFTAIARGALIACGHTAQLVQAVVCWPETAEYLTSHNSISHLTFIGSRSVAKHVARAASNSLNPLCLELGGKDPAIILDDLPDSDVDRVVATLVRGIFQSAGQNCIGIERIICLPKIYPKLISKLEPIIKSLRLGSALDEKDVDVGSCISSANFTHLENLIASAVEAGARLLVGGTHYHHPKYPKAHYFTPTLLVDVTPTMSIAHEELFAPIALLMRASSISDAIAIANSTEYALGSSVFGSSPETLETVTRGVKAGMVAVNDFAAYYAVQLPFGGTKGSGYGRFAGEEGLRALCNQKAVCRDRWPGIAKTSIPGPLRVPYGDADAAWDMGKGIVNVGYGESWGRRVEGVLGILGWARRKQRKDRQRKG